MGLFQGYIVMFGPTPGMYCDYLGHKLCYLGLFQGYTGPILYSRSIPGIYWAYIGLFQGYIVLYRPIPGIYWAYIGLFPGYIVLYRTIPGIYCAI